MAQADPDTNARGMPALRFELLGAPLWRIIARLRHETGHSAFHTGPSVRRADGVAFDLASMATVSAEALLDAGNLLAGFDHTDNEFLHA